MTKYLVSIEFRYALSNVDPDDEYARTSEIKTVTIGVYDDDETAIEEGNKALKVIEGIFPINIHGVSERRFSSRVRTISDLAYVKTPFIFYAKITTLDFSELSDVISDVLSKCIGGKQ
jgi:hypothetical protein